MAQLTAKDITNLYLYGQQSTPTNLVDDSLIRPEDFVAEFDVDEVVFCLNCCLNDDLVRIKFVNVQLDWCMT